MKMTKAKTWANILCHEDETPYLLIVTDGVYTSEIPVTHSSLKTVKKAAKDIYNARDILVSVIMDGQIGDSKKQ